LIFYSMYLVLNVYCSSVFMQDGLLSTSTPFNTTYIAQPILNFITYKMSAGPGYLSDPFQSMYQAPQDLQLKISPDEKHSIDQTESWTCICRESPSTETSTSRWTVIADGIVEQFRSPASILFKCCLSIGSNGKSPGSSSNGSFRSQVLPNDRERPLLSEGCAELESRELK